MISTFSLAWIILPIQMEYHNSGHFSFADKIKDAMRRNCIMACLAVVAGLAYMIYLLSTTGLSPSEVVGFMMALNNTYGVFLIILLMGSGLAALPRRLWQMGDNKQELRRLYISVRMCVYMYMYMYLIVHVLEYIINLLVVVVIIAFNFMTL